MTFLDRLERRFGRWTLPNFLPVWLLGQLLVFVGVTTEQITHEQLVLKGSLLRSGEAWRVISFMLSPKNFHPLWIVFSLFLSWLMGNALIAKWGEFRFNLYIGLAWFLTVAASWFFPAEWFINESILLLIPLAFAHLHPEFEIRYFFFLPIKMRYIGYILWGYVLLSLFTGELNEQIMAGAAVCSWLLFFGGDLLQRAKHKKRGQAFRRELRSASLAPMHTCSVCGKTDQTDPEIDFRYAEGKCYCASYLQKGHCDESSDS